MYCDSFGLCRLCLFIKLLVFVADAFDVDCAKHTVLLGLLLRVVCWCVRVICVHFMLRFGTSSILICAGNAHICDEPGFAPTTPASKVVVSATSPENVTGNS